MKYLLDTHIWLWSLLEPDRIDDNISEILRNDNNELFISPITIWETLILAEKGRIELRPTHEEWISEAIRRFGHTPFAWFRYTPLRFVTQPALRATQPKPLRSERLTIRR